LTSLGYTPIKLKPMTALPTAIASHTDILAFKLNTHIFLSKAYFDTFSDILPPLNKYNLVLTEESQGVNYPLDAIFNGLVMDNKLFCKKDSFSKEILAFCEKEGIQIIPTKQGYPACTVLKISENAAITADRGMQKALLLAGIDVLLIEDGSISLPPYEYGFIGGAGEADGDAVYFFGNIESHHDAVKIIDFIEKHGKRIVSLSDEPLRDLGGMIFI
ncbi:MAG: hypothetical protein IKV16_06915, partial [Clostridia bacterium]|nr:hypothetical protein [Clostridia bacterium]